MGSIVSLQKEMRSILYFCAGPVHRSSGTAGRPSAFCILTVLTGKHIDNREQYFRHLLFLLNSQTPKATKVFRAYELEIFGIFRFLMSETIMGIIVKKENQRILNVMKKSLEKGSLIVKERVPA